MTDDLRASGKEAILAYQRLLKRSSSFRSARSPRSSTSFGSSQADAAHGRCLANFARRFPAVAEALRSGASAQLRNAATVGGNLLQRTRSGSSDHPEEAVVVYQMSGPIR